ncbi:uncharacterized protein LOC131929900 [Physella acuta]|uniref:uncharacterized protein LOC131929900 n=1 Tax=Physella acuta TaxID=109671 RepID=UPI0027DD463C|nr:uncharacterized protein LOC131929900 [Physella acuta]
MMLVWLLVFLLFHLGNAYSETKPKNNTFVAVIVDFEVDCIQYYCQHTRKIFGFFWHPLTKETAIFDSCVRLDVYYCKANYQFSRCQNRDYWSMLCTIWEFSYSTEYCPNLVKASCQCKKDSGNRYNFTFNPKHYNWLKVVFIKGEADVVEESDIIGESPIFHANNYPDFWNPIPNTNTRRLYSTQKGTSAHVISGWIIATGAVVSVALAKFIG